MSFSAAKELNDWLTKVINAFEKDVGEIKFNKPKEDPENK